MGVLATVSVLLFGIQVANSACISMLLSSIKPWQKCPGKGQYSDCLGTVVVRKLHPCSRCTTMWCSVCAPKGKTPKSRICKCCKVYEESKAIEKEFATKHTDLQKAWAEALAKNSNLWEWYTKCECEKRNEKLGSSSSDDVANVCQRIDAFVLCEYCQPGWRERVLKRYLAGYGLPPTRY